MQARYFDGERSTAHPVELSLHADGRATIAGAGLQREAHWKDVSISERIGDAPRRIAFHDGASVETRDNDAVDAWLAAQGGLSLEHRVFRLERRWTIALAALAVTVLGSIAFIYWGVPRLADYAARILPRSIDIAIGRGGLEALDAVFFEPSALAPAKQAAVRMQFERVRSATPIDLPLQFELRSGGRVGANAFALPSGIIVMTDELVELAEHPQEIDSVLAHEIGHIVHRHSLRMLLQSSASALLMFTLLGDVSAASSLAASVPTVLVHAKHSRDFEREADAYAFAWMRRHGVPAHRFGDLLQRLESKHGGESDALSYFSSHPRTSERFSN